MRCFSIKKRIPVFKTSEQKLQLLHSVDGSEFRLTIWDIGIPDVNNGISPTSTGGWISGCHQPVV